MCHITSFPFIGGFLKKRTTTIILVVCYEPLSMKTCLFFSLFLLQKPFRRECILTNQQELIIAVFYVPTGLLRHQQLAPFPSLTLQLMTNSFSILTSHLTSSPLLPRHTRATLLQIFDNGALKLCNALKILQWLFAHWAF